MKQTEMKQTSKTSGNDSDDDEPAPPPLDAGYLSWKLPAEESHSDWTIEITESNNGSDDEKIKVSQVFHVHRAVLSVGPKKCVYFERLFQSKHFEESESHTSKINLDTIAAAAFPCMLDYLYSPEHKLDMTTENATALHHLGEYFECHRLRWEALQFSKGNLSIDNCGTYYDHAKLFKDDKFAKLVAKKCCECLDTIPLRSHLMKVSDVALWRSIIQLILEGKNGLFYDSKWLSLLIAKFCFSHKDTVDAETFSHFTDATHMMAIHMKAAIPLLQLEGSFLPESKTCEVLTSLQSRCIAPLSSSWKSIDVPLLQRNLAGLNPNVFTCLVTKAFTEAKLQLKTAEESGEEAKRQLKDVAIERLVVTGAGSAEVNGVYCRSKNFRKGAPVYTMSGSLQGEPAVFEMFVETIRDDTTGALHWWISRKESAAGRCISNYYYAPHVKGIPAPLSSELKKASAGLAPMPTVTIGGEGAA